MAQRVRNKLKESGILLVTVGIIIILGIVLAGRKQVEKPILCGYLFADGFGLECECKGELTQEKDVEDKVSKDGLFEHCNGKANQEICLKEFEGFKPLKPYVCSDFTYEAEIVPESLSEQSPLYLDSKYAYRAKSSTGEFVLETKEEVKCNKLRVMGFLEKIKMTDYQGMRMYAEKFECLE